jgi:four helix bundle protein
MGPKPKALLDRVITFGVDSATLGKRLRREIAGDHIGRQLGRCSTSIAAHYAEACEAESRADFIHKMKMALKELRESVVWLRIANAYNPSPAVARLLKESNELCAIFVASVKTAANSTDRPRRVSKRA